MCKRVATICLAAGYEAFKSFLDTSESDLHNNVPVCYLDPDDIITDDSTVNPVTNTDDWTLPEHPLVVNLNIPVQPELFKDPQVVQQRRVEREMLGLHVSSNHLPFPSLCAMAKSDLIPKRFAKFQVPLCGACLYESQTRTRWRTHATQSESTMATSIPGERILVDQLVLPTPGLTAQLSGKLTT